MVTAIWSATCHSVGLALHPTVGLADSQLAATPPMSLELSNCSFRMMMVWHFNKSKTAILPKLNVNPNLHVTHGAVLREQVIQIILRSVTIKVRSEDLHCSSYRFTFFHLPVKRNRRELVFKQWKQLLGGAEPHATSDKVAASNVFQLANSGRVGIRETNQHSLALEAWYRTRINVVNSQLNRCRNALGDLDNAWQPWVQSQVRFLDSIQETRDLYSNYYPVPDEWVRYAIRECTYAEEEYEIPTR
jgi:hypothetical protein